jgi:glycosyltransferase involved in cell wall biosynthesis
MSVAVEHPQLAAAKLEPIATIAFDTWALGAYARNHGVHVYARNLLAQFRELSREYGVEIRPYTCEAVDNDANGLAATRGFQPRATGLLKFSRIWRFGGACALASIRGVDLVFSPHFSSVYPPPFARAVIAIHDLIPVRMPLSSRCINGQARFCLWSAAKFSRAIITGSLHSKADLLDIYGIPDSKVSVIYYAYDKRIFNRAIPDPKLVRGLCLKLGIAGPYIVHHGAIKPSKNVKRLIQAYRLLRQRNKNLDLDLVLAGPLACEYEDVLAEVNRARRVILAGVLNDQDLGTLVKGATLAVIPSLYEGFCLPMIEAMACGVPTIAANSSCLPEISGGVLRYFNPESVEEMAVRMEEALEDRQLRWELSEKGTARASRFDWRRCAEETLAVLKEQSVIGR